MSNEDKQAKNLNFEIQEDRIIKKLLKNSNLTKIQFETILINFHLDERFGRPVKYEHKSKLRKSRMLNRNNPPVQKRGVTRGAFRRVLGQAGTNVIKSIYTLMLLAYVGLLESASLQPYVQLSDMLQHYLEELKAEGQELSKKELNQHLVLLEQRLVSIIDEYTDPFQVFGRS